MPLVASTCCSYTLTISRLAILLTIFPSKPSLLCVFDQLPGRGVLRSSAVRGAKYRAESCTQQQQRGARRGLPASAPDNIASSCRPPLVLDKGKVTRAVLYSTELYCTGSFPLRLRTLLTSTSHISAHLHSIRSCMHIDNRYLQTI